MLKTPPEKKVEAALEPLFMFSVFLTGLGLDSETDGSIIPLTGAEVIVL